MTKTFKKSFLALFIMLIALTLVSCGGSKKDISVTFMTPENGNGAYRLVAENKLDSEGNVVFPKEPEVFGYKFRGWFYEEECTTEFDAESKIKGSFTLYALMQEVKIDLIVTDGNGKNQTIKDYALIKLNEATDSEIKKAQEANLTFDGWYTNAECSTPYQEGTGATKLYARYMAKVEFYNGYEVVHEELVKPGQTVEMPSVDTIKKSYMDENDIFYVNENHEDFNFNSPINNNTTITVEWKTPFLEIELMKDSDEYRITGFTTTADRVLMDTFPVISIPSRILVDGEVKNITNVSASDFYLASSTRKIIFNEGIKTISYVNGGLTESVVEEIVLPSSLRIIDSSFNGYTNLKKINVPEGVEVIINSFFKNYKNDISQKDEGYDFEILIPSTVNNISLVPANLKYANDIFYNENGMVYKNDSLLGNVLVSVPTNVPENGILSIKDGVDAIQVGALDALELDYLNLPSSFKAVSYNNERADYPYYTGLSLTVSSAVVKGSNPATEKSMNSSAYAIIHDLTTIKYINFDTTEYPVDMNEYAFCNNSEGFLEYADRKVVFTGEVKEGNVNLYINKINTMSNEVKEVILEKAVGTVLDKDALLVELEITEELLGYKFKVDYIKQFGEDFDFTEALKSNIYLDIAVSYANKGFTVEENIDGTLTVNGYDHDTALLLPTGGYAVIIPAIDEQGRKIVAIKDSAFENNTEIQQVFISPSVKTIGARAFAGVENLDLVDIKAGGLEVIKESAFEMAGCVNNEGIYSVNEKLTKNKFNTPAISINLPLATLKTIEAKAFNSPAIREFLPADGETSRPVLRGFNFNTALSQDGFYFQAGGANGYGNVVILKITDACEDANPAYDNKKVYQADLVAVAAGHDRVEGSKSSILSFGQILFAGFGNPGTYVEVTIKSGAVAIYGEGYSEIQFALVKKVEQGAFVYLNEKYTTLDDQSKLKMSYFSKPFFTDGSKITSMSDEIFESGWLTGKTDEEALELLSHLQDNAGGTPGWS